MNFKKPLTLDKQVDKLEKYKNVIYKKICKEEAMIYLHKYNYTNLITPFKYNYCRWSSFELPEKDEHGNHIYENPIDFSNYVNCYFDERNKYQKIFNSISKFETIFKAVLAYRILTEYNIVDEASFDNFIIDLRSNTGENSKTKEKFDNFFGTHYRERCFAYFGKFKRGIEENFNGNIYVFFDNLSLGRSIAIYNCCKKEIKKLIFDDLKNFNVSFNYNDYYMFGQKLLIIEQIRNKVFHSGSIEIAIRFHDIKTKEIRHKDGPFSQSAYRNVLNRLL